MWVSSSSVKGGRGFFLHRFLHLTHHCFHSYEGGLQVWGGWKSSEPDYKQCRLNQTIQHSRERRGDQRSPELARCLQHEEGYMTWGGCSRLKNAITIPWKGAQDGSATSRGIKAICQTVPLCPCGVPLNPTSGYLLGCWKLQAATVAAGRLQFPSLSEL